jgi:hypothetical protein
LGPYPPTVGQENCSFLLLHIRADLFCIRHFTLHNPKMAVQIGIRRGTHHLLAPTRETLLFFFRHLRQEFMPAAIPTECALDRSYRCVIYLNRLFFDIEVRFVVTVSSEAFDALTIHSALTRLPVGFRRPRRICVGRVRFSYRSPRF